MLLLDIRSNDPTVYLISILPYLYILRCTLCENLILLKVKLFIPIHIINKTFCVYLWLYNNKRRKCLNERYEIHNSEVLVDLRTNYIQSNRL